MNPFASGCRLIRAVSSFKRVVDAVQAPNYTIEGRWVNTPPAILKRSFRLWNRWNEMHWHILLHICDIWMLCQQALKCLLCGIHRHVSYALIIGMPFGHTCAGDVNAQLVLLRRGRASWQVNQPG